MKTVGTLHLCVLGPMEIRRGRKALELPSSKKARALLAYLVANPGPHRRDRLTDLFWDIADDPKAGLRWCLTKIRPLVDEPQHTRINADRETVEFQIEGAEVDYFTARALAGKKAGSLQLKDLEELAALFRGTFLEGLELPDHDRFQAWLIAERENALRLHLTILRGIVQRLSQDAGRAAPWARLVVERDPFDEEARTTLSRLLITLGRHAEARQVAEHGQRLARELGDISFKGAAQTQRLSPDPEPVVSQLGTEVVTPEWASHTAMLGRDRELSKLRSLVEHCQTKRTGHVILIKGEPGVGKSRLLSEVAAAVPSTRGTVLTGRSYEAEACRPYRPWIDAIQSLHPSVIGQVLGDALAPLLTGVFSEDEEKGGRDRLFAAIVELLAARAHSASPVVLQLDDIQWCDEASAELLHYVVRMTRHRPVIVCLAARSGELPDNPAMMRVLRSFRRDRWIEELALEPLSADDTAQLAQLVSPSMDTAMVFGETAGNPLYTIETARADGAARSADGTLAGLIRDRVDRLPSTAADVLKWVAVLGSKFTLDRAASLTPLSADELTDAIELLQRHALVKNFGFSHNIVRRSVYDDLSEPRRRLMHRRAAQVFGQESDKASTAAEVAHHAALAGEAAIAARASIQAGRYCLRLYANTEAQVFAGSGSRHAEGLLESERVSLQIELMEVSFSAGRPKDVDETARTLEELSEKALLLGDIEHARLGFRLLSYLRWEGGDWSGAQRDSLRAELVSRKGGQREQVVAMAETALCLAMLERDMPQAEALALEARTRAAHDGIETVAIPAAIGMLRLHQGEWDEAEHLFLSARELARREGDAMGEFRALEHLVVLELERGNPAAARLPSNELCVLASKLREGSEAPFARCLSALTAEAAGENAAQEIDLSLESLRMADAKHRLAYALLRAATGDLSRKDANRARARAEEALRLADILDRPSERAMAHVVLLRSAMLGNSRPEIERHLNALRSANTAQLAAHVRQAVSEFVSPQKGATRGTRARGTKIRDASPN